MKNRKKHVHFSAVRMLRAMKGLTIGALAEAVGLQAMDIIRIEQGRNCLIDRFVSLAEYFGVSVNALMKNDICAIAQVLKSPVEWLLPCTSWPPPTVLFPVMAVLPLV